MLKLLKLFLPTLILLILVAGHSIAAPVSNITRSVVPETDNIYYVGTSTARYNRFILGTGSSTSMGGIEAQQLTASSSTATSTFYGGIQLRNFNCSAHTNSGALTVDASGNVICSNDDGGGGGTINSGTINRLTYYSGDTTLDSANFLTVNTADSILTISGNLISTLSTTTNSTTTNAWISGDLRAASATIATMTVATINATSSITSQGALNVYGDTTLRNGLLVSAGTVVLPAGEIGNAELANSSLTVTAGNGLTGGGAISLGGSATLNLVVDSTLSVGADSVGLNLGSVNTWTALQTFNGGLVANNATTTGATSTDLWVSRNLVMSSSTVGTLNAGVFTATGTSVFLGNLGLGTTNPGTNLHIISSGDGADNSQINDFALSIGNNSDTTGVETGIGFRVSSSQGGTVGVGAAITHERLGSNSIGSLNFKTSPSLDVLTTTMTILNNGNLGIGTTTPGKLFSVHGDVLMASTTVSNLVATGTIVARTGLMIPSGANPTVDKTGMIAVDTSDDQFVYNGGSSTVRVIPYMQDFSFAVASSTSFTSNDGELEKLLLKKMRDNVTIQRIECITDAGTQVISLYETTSIGGITNLTTNGVDGATTITCDSDGATDDGSLSNPSIDSGDWIALHWGAAATSPRKINITIFYSVNRD